MQAARVVLNVLVIAEELNDVDPTPSLWRNQTHEISRVN